MPRQTPGTASGRGAGGAQEEPGPGWQRRKCSSANPVTAVAHQKGQVQG